MSKAAKVKPPAAAEAKPKQPKHFTPVLWDPRDCIPYENNAKKHPPEQVAAIATALARFGPDQPIVVDRDGVIIKGHGRRLAAISNGWDLYPVIVRTDLSPAEVKAARLSDNRAALSDVDPNMLRAEMMQLEGMELLIGIFDAKELDFINADLGEMNMDVFVTDMDKVVTDQKLDLDTRISGAEVRRLPLAKAFGFKDVPATAGVALAALLARAELATGMKDGDALVAWAEKEFA